MSVEDESLMWVVSYVWQFLRRKTKAIWKTDVLSVEMWSEKWQTKHLFFLQKIKNEFKSGKKHFDYRGSFFISWAGSA